MYTIENNINNPFYNLALEEYLLKSESVPGDIVWLWQNEPSVIIGRNQNTVEEINESLIREKGIHVARRLSGGGAVYHDFGNVNFTFISSSRKADPNIFRRFTMPVIAALRDLGVNADFSGRNDIVVDAKKISGNAQAYHKNRMFHHGTLLYEADLDIIAAVLNVAPDKISSKGVKSVRSRVDNIRPHMRTDMTTAEFKEHLLQSLLATKHIGKKVYALSEKEKTSVEALAEAKYRTRAWNYGESPVFELVKSGRCPGGKITFHINISRGKISACRIYGDFFGKEDIGNLAAALTGVYYTKEGIKEFLRNFPLADYVYNISGEDIMRCLF